jgi:hypothetical protein
MKFDSQKAFPYPVLRPDVDDYIDGEFQATVDFVGDEENQVTAAITMALSVPEIQTLIDDDSAEFVTVFACRDTYFRESVRSNRREYQKKFNNGSFRGEVTVYPFVLAKRDIAGFCCADINAEYGTGPFEFKTGEVLALDEPKVVFIDRDLFKPVSSVFELCKEENLKGFEWQLGFDEEKVRIKVSPEAKEKIDVARNRIRNRATLINSLYFSAAMEAISKLKETKEFDELRWARVIRQQCHNLSINLDSHDSYAVTQRLMKNPLGLLDVYLFRSDE